jgi:hypothetical protein
MRDGSDSSSVHSVGLWRCSFVRFYQIRSANRKNGVHALSDLSDKDHLDEVNAGVIWLAVNLAP